MLDSWEPQGGRNDVPNVQADVTQPRTWVLLRQPGHNPEVGTILRLPPTRASRIRLRHVATHRSVRSDARRALAGLGSFRISTGSGTAPAAAIGALAHVSPPSSEEPGSAVWAVSRYAERYASGACASFTGAESSFTSDAPTAASMVARGMLAHSGTSSSEGPGAASSPGSGPAGRFFGATGSGKIAGCAPRGWLGEGGCTRSRPRPKNSHKPSAIAPTPPKTNRKRSAPDMQRCCPLTTLTIARRPCAARATASPSNDGTVLPT
jgi:hypothetical protein